MSSRAMSATAEQPTPSPSSAVVANDPPRELRDDPFVAYVMAMSPDQHAYVAARARAAEEGRRLYGDESSDAWLAALVAGTHPLCAVAEPSRT